MKHLSGLDNLFLALDQGNQYMHVGGLGIYDPATAEGSSVRFKSVLNFFANRLNASKVFRRRLVSAPFGLDRPYWVEDGELDIEYHVRHIALPHPGDWRQLMIQTARIHARPLDMSKPLWEAYIIEGLDNIPGISEGSFALYVKFHHAAVDGEAGAELIRAIHSLTAELDTDAMDAAQTIVADRDPTPVELYARAVANRTRQVFDASKLVVSLSSRMALASKDMVVSGEALKMGKGLVDKALGRKKADSDAEVSRGDTAGLKPQTRFDNELSAHRVVDAVGFSLADCKKIRQHIDKVTINDIFMAATGGALRKYLESKNELPTKSLNAMVPMTTRGEVKDMDAGNQIGMTAMPLRTDIPDPLERLLAVRRGTSKGKAMSASLGKDLPAQLINVLPSAISERLMRHGLTSLANITVSNVRGPDIPLYMAGAQLQLFLPVSIPFSGLGLNVTGFSYNGTLWVCFVSCRQMLPDPAFFAQCLSDSFEEIVTAAIAAGPKVGSHAAAARAVREAAKPTTKTATAKPRKPPTAGKTATRKTVAKK